MQDSQPVEAHLAPGSATLEDDTPVGGVTGLVSLTPEDVSPEPVPTPEPVCDPHVPPPGSSKDGMVGGKKRKQEVMISKPPLLQTQPPVEGSVEGDVEAQRVLKRKIEDEAKEQAEKKKQAAEDKKRKATAEAVAKAQAKLDKAMAKAKALEENGASRRGRGGAGAKRKLEPELAAASKEPEATAPAAASQPDVLATSPPKAPKRKPSVKLSPKAREFASPTKKASDTRMVKAVENLKMLRGLQISDLELPATGFAKKILACTHAYAFQGCVQISLL